MSFTLFHGYLPEIAKSETRTIILSDEVDVGLPAAHYSFLEMFCDEPGCDCRRVLFYVVSSLRNDLVAVIAYGWETPEFYARWMGSNDPSDLAELKGPVLNLGSPQSADAPEILEMAADLLLTDKAYMDRVKRHYAMFRERIDKKTPPKSRREKAHKRKNKSRKNRKRRV
ncbi:MAG: hypothetical protein HQ581_24470 [Planctomycetes bacterium]|nr:hypothetical protein [Planctomycetota bacterium]